MGSRFHGTLADARRGRGERNPDPEAGPAEVESPRYTPDARRGRGQRIPEPVAGPSRMQSEKNRIPNSDGSSSEEAVIEKINPHSIQDPVNGCRHPVIVIDWKGPADFTV